MSFIKNIRLIGFRNHLDKSLSVDNPTVLLLGNNGVGKTSILEAISLLGPGRGLRNAKLSDIVNQSQSGLGQWGVKAVVIKNGQEYEIDTGYINTGGASKRVVKVNGNNLSKQSDLLQYLRTLWLTPQMERALFDSTSARRNLLDRLTYNFFPDHAQNILAYNYYAKNRLQALLQLDWDNTWLDSTEKQMALLAIELIKNRKDSIEILQKVGSGLKDEAITFPKLALKSGLNEIPKNEMLEEIQKGFIKARHRDANFGKNTFSPHRSELKIFHSIKNIESVMCSTGEQKSMLVSIILAQVKALVELYEIHPIVLLDDPLEHLDQETVLRLRNTIKQLSCQIWITTTKKEFADSLGNGTNVFYI